MASSQGKITQVLGAVVDVAFDGDLPELYTALAATNPAIDDKSENLVLEVAQHLGQKSVRCIAMDTTDGLVRGMPVRNTEAPIQTPVGPEILGRILNVTGAPIDEMGEVKAKLRWPIHREAPSFTDQSSKIETF